jgi:hypothetical protein
LAENVDGDLRVRPQFFPVAISFLVILVVTTAPRVSAQDIFVTPIPGEPFSGVVEVERLLIHSDGSSVRLKTVRDIARDSQGRIYNESRALVPISSTETPQLLRIHLYDPQTRISTVLNPRERTFSIMTVARPPATLPPALVYAAPTGNSLPQNEFTKEEDLGIRDMEGSPAHGVRETQIIPAESSGAGREIVITDEYWYSDDLRINLVIKHSDPRTGAVTMTVSELTRAEPDRARFEIPDGYKTARSRRTNQH